MKRKTVKKEEERYALSLKLLHKLVQDLWRPLLHGEKGVVGSDKVGRVLTQVRLDLAPNRLQLVGGIRRVPPAARWRLRLARQRG